MGSTSNKKSIAAAALAPPDALAPGATVNPGAFQNPDALAMFLGAFEAAGANMHVADTNQQSHFSKGKDDVFCHDGARGGGIAVV